jgi:hypothetical protein
MLSALRRGGSRVTRSLTRCDSTWSKPQMASDMPTPGDARSRLVTVLPGDGVGPEVVRAAQQVVAATGGCGQECTGARRGGVAGGALTLGRLFPSTCPALQVPLLSGRPLA